MGGFTLPPLDDSLMGSGSGNKPTPFSFKGEFLSREVQENKAIITISEEHEGIIKLNASLTDDFPYVEGDFISIQGDKKDAQYHITSSELISSGKLSISPEEEQQLVAPSSLFEPTQNTDVDLPTPPTPMGTPPMPTNNLDDLDEDEYPEDNTDDDYPEDEDPVRSHEKPSKDSGKKGLFSIKESIKAALDEVKKEREGVLGQQEDEDDYEDDYEEEDDQEEEEKAPKKGRGKGKGKGKNPLKGIKSLYSKIAMFLFGLIMKPIKFLAKVPVLGIIFNLIKKLEKVIKLICFLWLPIILLLFYPMFSGGISVGGGKSDSVDSKPEKVKTDNQTFSKGDISIEIMKVKEGKNPTITVKNQSKVYSNFSGNVTFDKPSFFGKKVKCVAPITLIGVGEEKELKLKCNDEVKTSKIKDFDIITEYEK